MKTSKTKINIAVGVATGLLVGFVLGIAFGMTDSESMSVSNAEGNISRLSRHKLDTEAGTDKTDSTINLSAVDSEGNSWEITVNKK